MLLLRLPVHDQRVRRRIKIVDFAGVGSPKVLGQLCDLPTLAKVGRVVGAVGNEWNEDKSPRDASHQGFDEQACKQKMNHDARENRAAQEDEINSG